MFKRVSERKQKLNDLMKEIAGKDVKDRSEVFDDLLRAYESWMLNDTDASVPAEAQRLFLKLITYKEDICGHFTMLVQALRIFSIAQGKAFVLPNVRFVEPLFIKSCLFGDSMTQILRLCGDFFRPLFADKKFECEALSGQLPSLFFEQVCTECSNEQAVQWGFDILIGNICEDAYASIDTRNFFKAFVEFVKQGKKRELNKVIARNVQKFALDAAKYNKATGQVLSSLGCFQALKELMCDQEWELFMSEILVSGCPSEGVNESVAQCLGDLFKTDEHVKLQVFRIVRQFTRYKAVNAYLPIVDFFDEKSLPLTDLINVFTEVDDLYPEMVKNILPSLCKRMCLQTLDQVEYQKLLNVVRVQLSKEILTKDDLKIAGILSAVIVGPPMDMRINLFQENEWLLANLIDLLPCEVEAKEKVFGAILEVAHVIPGPAVRYLVMEPRKGNIKILLDFLSGCDDTRYFDVLQSALDDTQSHDKLAEKFVDCNGLDAMEQWREGGKLLMKQYLCILASLVSSCNFEEVEQFVTHLSPAHPIFHLDSEAYDDLVYGKQKGQYRPIRLASLFLFLGTAAPTDPYNSYILGRFALKPMLKSGISIHSIPQLQFIANRYIRPKYVDLILQQPEGLDGFCDISKFDHFPLFQLYPGPNELSFDVEYRSISFWCKFNDNSASCEFFNADYISLTLKGNDIGVSINGAPQKPPEIGWRVGEWNHVLLQLESSFLSSTLSVTINSQLASKKSVGGKGLFTKAVFYNRTKDLMFLGSAIRFFAESIVSSTALSQKPGLIDSMNEIALLTPFNISQASECYKVTVPDNCFSVPYCGFPMHFVSMRRFVDLFDILVKSTSVDQFNSIFNAILNIYSIVGQYSEHFWSNLLGALKHCQQFLSKELFEKALRYVLVQEKSMNSLQSMLFDQDVWEALDNHMLLSALEDIFNEFKCDMDDVDLFLGKLILKNPQNESVVDKVLNMGHTRNIGHYLMAILRDNKEEVARDTVATCLARYAYREGTKVLKIVPLDSEVLRKMLCFASGHFAASLYSLYTNICLKDRRFSCIDLSMLRSVISLSHERSTWENTQKLIQIDIAYLPFLVGLVGARAIYMIWAISNNQSENNEIDSYFEAGVVTCSAKCNEVLTNRTCTQLLASLYPVILGLTVFFDTCQDSSLREFVEKIITSSLRQDVEVAQCAFMTDPVNVFIKKCPLFGLYGKLLVHANLLLFKQLFLSLYLSFPYHDASWAGSFLWSLVERIQECDLTKFLGILPFLSYLAYFLSANKCFLDTELKLFFDMLRDSVPVKQRSETYFMVLLEVLLAMKEGDACSTVKKNLDFVVGAFLEYKMERCLYYLASTSDDMLNILRTSTRWTPRQLQSLNGDKSTIRKELEAKRKSFLDNTEKDLKSELPVCDFTSLFPPYEEEERKRMEEKATHKLELLHSAFDITAEKTKWNQFVSTLHDKMVDVGHFKPKSYHMSPKCFPFNAPRLLVASLYPFRSQELSERFESQLTKLSKKANSTMLKQMFLKMFGEKKPNHHVQVHLHRYTEFVKAVMFIFPDEIIFLTHAVLDANDNITFTEWKTDKYFIESAIVGMWGQTSMFFGHIVIKVPMSQIISVQLFRRSFAFWTFHAGHFIVKPADGRSLAAIRYKMTNIAMEATGRLSGAPMFVRAPCEKTAFQKWSVEDISTDELLLCLNGLSGKSFASLRDYPYFPMNFSSDQLVHEFSRRETATLLTRFVPFTVFGMDARIYFPDSEAEISFDGPSSEVLTNDETVMTKDRCQSTEKFMITTNHIDSSDSELSSESQSGIAVAVQLRTPPMMRRGDRRCKRIRRASYIAPEALPVTTALDAPDVRSRLDSTIQGSQLTSAACRDLVAQFTELGTDRETEANDIPALFYYSPELLGGWHPARRADEDLDEYPDFDLVGKRRDFLEDEKNLENIIGWIHQHQLSKVRFARRQESGNRLRNSEIANLDLTHLCQRLKTACPKSKTLMEVGDKLERVHRLTVPINATHVVAIDRRSLSISILLKSSDKKVFTIHNNFLFFAESIAISANKMFVVVDFEFGLSRCYQIVYKAELPSELLQISEFAWKGSPVSAISGVHWLVATFVRNMLVLWDMFGGVIHRTFSFGSKITAIAFDEHYGVWVATPNQGYFVSVNGEILATRKLPEEITKIGAFQHHDVQHDRYAVCGTSSGSIYLAMVRFDTHTIDVKVLPSEHKSEIVNIIILQLNKSFITVDCTEIACHWSAPAASPPPLHPSCYLKCCVCYDDDCQVPCKSCGHAMCRRCAQTDRCPYCIEFICN